jgi:hypothetical protein
VNGAPRSHSAQTIDLGARLAIFCVHGLDSHQPDAARHLDMTAEENYTC